MFPARRRHTNLLQPQSLFLSDLLIGEYLPQLDIQHTRPLEPPLDILEHNRRVKPLALKDAAPRRRLARLPERQLAHVRRHPRREKRLTLICQGVEIDFFLRARFDD